MSQISWSTFLFYCCRIMTSNNLSHLAPGSFAVYGELEMLILDDNFLTTIPLDVLDNNLTKLTHL